MTPVNDVSREKIDNIVISHADNDSEWEEPVHVRKTKSTKITIPADLAARAAFLANLHGEPGVEEWILRIIRERIELEEGKVV